MNRIIMLNRVQRIVVEQLRQHRSVNFKHRRARPLTMEEKEERQTANLANMFDQAVYHDRDFDFQENFKTQRTPGQSYRKKAFNKQELRYHDTDKYNAVFHDDFFDEYKPRSRPRNNDKRADDKRKSEKDSRSISEVASGEKEKEGDGEHKKNKKKKAPKIQSPKLPEASLPNNITAENRFEILNQQRMPLYSVPYETQTRYKHRKNKQILKVLGDKLYASNSPIQLQRSGMACPLDYVVPSPTLEEYRNKDVFNVGPGIDGNTKTVGFLVGKVSNNEKLICVEPDNVSVTKKRHIELAKMFQDYLRTKSKLDYCQDYDFEGHWRRMMVRSNESGDTMLVVNMHPRQLLEAEIQQEMRQIKEYFENSVTSLYFSHSKNILSINTKSPEVIHHLAGSETITENILNSQFIISPNSAFPLNTLGAEKLYQTVIDELRPHKNDIVLDFCCGTGILSTLLSEHCHQVIGIDSSPASIADAKLNAQKNGLTNVQFILAKVGDILPILDSLFEEGKRVIAVMNPSKRALKPRAIKAIREKEAIKKVVYVSCKPEGRPMTNLYQLCQNAENLDRFVPINAVPVDLLPHTEHCELVLTFERIHF